nr:hypothetical protein [Mucilaginibacter sp. SP1R1]
MKKLIYLSAWSGSLQVAIFPVAVSLNNDRLSQKNSLKI